MSENNLLNEYADLFDEEGANPEEIKHRARRSTYQIRKTKEYARTLMKQRLKRQKEKLAKLKQETKELSKLISEKKSPKLKKVLVKKTEETKKVCLEVRMRAKMLRIVSKTLNEKLEWHQQVLKQFSEKRGEERDCAPSYIG